MGGVLGTHGITHANAYVEFLGVPCVGCNTSLPLFDCLVLGPGQILSTDCVVLIIDQICLVILDPHQFPDVSGMQCPSFTCAQEIGTSNA